MSAEWDCVVDAGNSRIKVGWWQAKKLVETEILSHADWSRYQPKHAAKRVIIASVSLPESQISERFLDAGMTNLKVWQASEPLPFTSEYTSLETMGIDRKMLVVGANHRYPHSNRLVISLGSCITYDLINSQNHHLGGDISPGMHMRWQAMHSFTARLPLVSMPPDVLAWGTNTQGALQSGVLNGILAEIMGRIKQFEAVLGDLTIILSGGDLHFFEKRLDNRIFAEPNLALYGLHALI